MYHVSLIISLKLLYHLKHFLTKSDIQSSKQGKIINQFESNREKESISVYLLKQKRDISMEKKYQRQSFEMYV